MSGKNPSSAPAARRARAVESFKSAAETIGKIEHGSTVFAITRGQFSMIDAILHTLDELGPSEISAWTWTVADYEIEALTSLRRDGRITRGTLVIDPGARTKNSALIAEWKAAFGADSVRYVLNHAKIATVANGDKKVLLRGSMNLNCNPRFEQFDLSEGGGGLRVGAANRARVADSRRRLHWPRGVCRQPRWRGVRARTTGDVWRAETMGEMSRDELRAKLIEANPRAKLEIVERYLDAFTDYRTAQANITEHGTIVFHPRTGAPIANPYLAIRAGATKEMDKCKLRADALWTP